MINLIVITHGDFGAYLVEAAENIAGPQHEGLRNICVSPRMSLEAVNEAVGRAAEEFASPDGLIFMTDMPGGTPMNVALPLAQKMEKSAVICGINLSMLISAFSNRKNMSFEALVEKIQHDGKRAVCEVKSLLRPKN